MAIVEGMLAVLGPGGNGQSIDLTKNQEGIINQDWLSSASVPFPSKFGHAIAERDGLLYCGGSGFETACYKIKYGASSWSQTSFSINIPRKGSKSSLVMGGLFMTLGENTPPGK